MAARQAIQISNVAEASTPDIPIPLGAVSLTLPDDMQYADWRGLGETLADRYKNTVWLIGDWFAHGQTRFAEQLKLDLPKITDDPKMLRKAAKVAQAFQPADRNVALSYQHHAHVADMPADEAKALLDKARRENWTAREMRIKAMARKLEIGQTQIFSDDDYEYHEMQAIARAWNRARPSARSEFLEMANEAEGGVIDV